MTRDPLYIVIPVSALILLSALIYTRVHPPAPAVVRVTVTITPWFSAREVKMTPSEPVEGVRSAFTPPPAGPTPQETVVPPTATPSATSGTAVTPTPTLTPTISPTSSPTLTSTSTLTPTFTPTATPRPQVRVLAPLLNVRSGPGITYPVLRIAAAGDTFTLLGRNRDGSWLQICCLQEGRVGWISGYGGYAKVTVPLEQIPVVPVSTPTPTQMAGGS